MFPYDKSFYFHFLNIYLAFCHFSGGKKVSIKIQYGIEASKILGILAFLVFKVFILLNSINITIQLLEEDQLHIFQLPTHKFLPPLQNNFLHILQLPKESYNLLAGTCFIFLAILQLHKENHNLLARTSYNT